MPLTDEEAIVLVYFRSRNYSHTVIQKFLEHKMPNLTVSDPSSLSLSLREICTWEVRNGHGELRNRNDEWDVVAVDNFVTRRGRALRDPFQLTHLGVAEREIIARHARSSGNRRQQVGRAPDQLRGPTPDVAGTRLAQRENIEGHGNKMRRGRDESPRARAERLDLENLGALTNNIAAYCMGVVGREVIDRHAEESARRRQEESLRAAAERSAFEQIGPRPRDARTYELGSGEGIGVSSPRRAHTGSFTPINRRALPDPTTTHWHGPQTAIRSSPRRHCLGLQHARSHHDHGTTGGTTGGCSRFEPREDRDDGGARRSASPRRQHQIQHTTPQASAPRELGGQNASGTSVSKPRAPCGRDVYGL